MIRDGKEVRFSKRSGEVEELSDLLEEVGSDVARFVFLMRSANSQFDFDLDQALKQSSDNPVFYVQYGHARMATLLKRASDQGTAFAGVQSLTNQTLARLSLPQERAMIKKIAAYPEIVLAAAQHLEPHRVLYYCQELIAEFHSYFTKYRHTERIISDDAELTTARLGLIASLKQTLSNALNLLGISAPESMHQHDGDEELENGIN
jgi:arginyl-tRNA synthetase